MRRMRGLPVFPFPAPHHATQRGLTLLELAVAMFIACIGIGVGLPSYQHLVQQNRADTVRYLLTSHFASARQTAVTYRRATVVCPSDGVEAGCRADGDWGQGWLMFFDPDGNRKPDAAEDVLRYEAVPLPPDFRIRSSVGRPQLRYLPDGRSAGSNLTVRICLRERLMSEVVVNNGGRARSRRAASGESCRG